MKLKKKKRQKKDRLAVKAPRVRNKIIKAKKGFRKARSHP